MTYYRHALLTTLALMLAACSSVDSTKPFDQQQAAILIKQDHGMKPARQRIQLSLPKQQWQRIDLSLGTVGSPIMLIPNHATADNWDQSIRTKIKARAEDRTVTTQQFAQSEIEAAKRDCQSTTSTLLSSTATETSYRIDMTHCGQDKHLTQIGKALKGSDAIYLVYYTAKDSISSTEINRYTRIIEHAQLVHDPRHDEM